MDKEQRSFSLHWGWAKQLPNAISCVRWCPPRNHSPFPCNHESSAEFWCSVDMDSFRHKKSHQLHRGWGCLGQQNNHVKDGLRELCKARIAIATVFACSYAGGCKSRGSLLKGNNCFLLCTGTIRVSFLASNSLFPSLAVQAPAPRLWSNKTEFCCFTAEGLRQLWHSEDFQVQ